MLEDLKRERQQREKMVREFIHLKSKLTMIRPDDYMTQHRSKFGADTCHIYYELHELLTLVVDRVRDIEGRLKDE